ncbi:MAG: hypothetical protein R3F31_07685 [Verrucomicrobiales bacterium]
MAAYKIIYGAGPTLTREESRFGRGYGFVGMHRHPAVKELAFRDTGKPSPRKEHLRVREAVDGRFLGWPGNRGIPSDR